MLYIIAAIVIGAISYGITVATRSRDGKAAPGTSLADCRTTAIASLMCFGYVAWRFYGQESGASLRSLLAIWPSDDPYRSVLCAAGYAAATYSVFAGIHAAVLKAREARLAIHDA